MKRFLAAGALLLAGCPGHGGGAKYPEPSTKPSVHDILAKLAEQQTQRTSFTGESVMDYWIGKQRLKGTVLVMGTQEKQVRFNALSPQGGGVLADMACDAGAFTLVDYQNNCVLTGPCNADSIAAFLHVRLEPDDFYRLAIGLPPAPADGTGDVTWDAKQGAWIATFDVPGGKETVVVDAREGRFDVVKASLDGADGWTLESKDFEDGLPKESHFVAPAQQADLAVEWNERKLNVSLPAAKFFINVPSGLPVCP